MTRSIFYGPAILFHQSVRISFYDVYFQQLVVLFRGLLRFDSTAIIAATGFKFKDIFNWIEITQASQVGPNFKSTSPFKVRGVNFDFSLKFIKRRLKNGLALKWLIGISLRMGGLYNYLLDTKMSGCIVIKNVRK